MPGKKKGVKKGKKGKSGSKSKNKDKTKRDAIHQPVESVRPPLFHGEKVNKSQKIKQSYSKYYREILLENSFFHFEISYFHFVQKKLNNWDYDNF